MPIAWHRTGSSGRDASQRSRDRRSEGIPARAAPIRDETAGRPDAEVHEALVLRIRSADRDALTQLIDLFWRPLVSFSATIVGAVDDAEDVVQDVFVRVWNQPNWAPVGTVSAWLYRITRNLSLNRVWNEAVETRSRALGAPLVEPSPRTPAEDFDERALRLEVEAAIAALPERRREAFILARFHGLSHREIAEVMGISPNTVANQVTAALDELRLTLRDRLPQG